MTRPAPYPADTRSKGWRFELDLERVKASDTWALAPADLRPWLYMLWAESWLQTPCGSLPSDDALLAARIGMQAKAFTKAKLVLLRGWWLADDGRLYHDTIVALVKAMLHRKEAEKARKAEYRARMEAERRQSGADVPHLSHGTDTGRTPDSNGTDDTGTGTGTGTGLEIPSNLTVAPARPSDDQPPALALVQTTKPRKPAPDCPQMAVLQLWQEVLPALPQHIPSQWKGARADHLRTRWRETAIEKGWADKADGLAYMRKLFTYIGRSPFLTGRSSVQPGKKPFVIELEWLVVAANWAKVIEGKYHQDAA